MLSIYRCDQIADEAYKQFLGDIQPFQQQIQKEQIIENFGALGAELVQKYLSTFFS
jgi:hypothetical protein